MSLKTKLSGTIALVALLTVALISVSANLLIEQQFKCYIMKQQRQQIEELLADLGKQFDAETRSWNVDMLHSIGMAALYDGFIVKISDGSDAVLWDAESCDMASCRQVMDDTIQRMRQAYPRESGEFTAKQYPLTRGEAGIGSASISSYGSYFLNENDVLFLGTLNKVLLAVGAVALLLSLAVGVVLSRRLSSPILQVVLAVERIAGGKRETRLEPATGTVELDKLIGSVNGLARSIEEQEALRKRLTADVAHELRTPLTTMQTHIEAMSMGVWQPTPERLRGCLDEVVRLGKIVADLESLARVESGAPALRKTQVDLTEVVRGAAGGFEAECRRKGLSLTVCGDCGPLRADGERIAQVVVNLLSNAVKYTEPGGSIEVSLSQTGGEAVLKVRDTGCGIAEAELPFIFERFYRADTSRNRDTGGSGIGLSIVLSIVEAHGGSVSAASEAGVGSVFTVKLPK